MTRRSNECKCATAKEDDCTSDFQELLDPFKPLNNSLCREPGFRDEYSRQPLHFSAECKIEADTGLFAIKACYVLVTK